MQRLPPIDSLSLLAPRPELTTQRDRRTSISIPPISELFGTARASLSEPRQAKLKSRRCKPSAITPRTPPPSRKTVLVGGLPLETYSLDKVPFTMQRPDNEEINSVQRKTIDGRVLTYILKVLQQPERARACGAGARSSADRRPVDPPPVVELRIIEGTGKNTTDITLGYNASFFLFATLEVARPIAGGRMHSAPIIPVLTGVPVAGTNYLDRPTPAGYFIFPDLSVRHEGFYRLVFNLYEATKEEGDADVDRPFRPISPTESSEDRTPNLHENMALRLDVRSAPFQVYSAKKFPGLSESTPLSRLVADQGCRVRIRRDVRMRKRGDRKDDFDPYEDGQRSIDRYATPESTYPPQTPIERPRSISHASMDGSQYSGEHYHRPSIESAYTGHGYHSSIAPISSHPSQASAGYIMQPHPTTTPGGQVSPRYSAHAQPAPMPAPADQGFSLPRPFHRSSHDRTVDTPLYAPPHRPSDPKSSYWNQLPNPLTLHRSVSPDLHAQQSETASTLPSIRSLSDASNPAPPAGTYDHARKQWNMPEPPSASKRSYSPLASNSHQQPLKGGMRPDTAPSVNSWGANGIEPDRHPYRDSEDDSFEDAQRTCRIMNYRRADGKMSRKHVPYTDATSRDF